MINSFLCNICGTENSLLAPLHRELIACGGCRSNARFRGIISALAANIGERKPLKDWEERKHIKILGMSDSESYANILSEKFDYINTYFHQSPHLDIGDLNSAARYSNIDYIISSDVLEHVMHPVQSAFDHMYTMLKEDGVLIISVPTLEGYETIEHYGAMKSYRVFQIEEHFIVAGIDMNGICFTHLQPRFHGGPGEVLELRIFGVGDLKSRLASAGFTNLVEHIPNQPKIGYVWDDQIEIGVHPSRRSLGHIITARKVL